MTWIMFKVKQKPLFLTRLNLRAILKPNYYEGLDVIFQMLRTLIEGENEKC